MQIVEHLGKQWRKILTVTGNNFLKYNVLKLFLKFDKFHWLKYFCMKKYTINITNRYYIYKGK